MKHWHIVIAGIGLGLALFGAIGCAHNEVVLPSFAGDAFREVVGHGAVTVSDRLTIFGTAQPPDDQIKCHEAFHRAQARSMGDAAVESHAIKDTVADRTAYWLLIYAYESLRSKATGGSLYRDNRFEADARAACP
jgi:hypothetical protein